MNLTSVPKDTVDERLRNMSSVDCPIEIRKSYKQDRTISQVVHGEDHELYPKTENYGKFGRTNKKKNQPSAGSVKENKSLSGDSSTQLVSPRSDQNRKVRVTPLSCQIADSYRSQAHGFKEMKTAAAKSASQPFEIYCRSPTHGSVNIASETRTIRGSSHQVLLKAPRRFGS